MDSERNPPQVRRTASTCRSCKQPVDTVMERHKTMGVYVPRWTAGPCHNQHCDQYVPEQVPVSSLPSTTWKALTGRARR
ncbi:hypothetical protein [Streptomyces sp. NPDC126514]|uniref:hypothetical protein n=1 Tax=Streptomyces sp. NPDC126514 TaxID=3155210 RepID=UPI00332BDE24